MDFLSNLALGVALSVLGNDEFMMLWHSSLGQDLGQSRAKFGWLPSFQHLG